MQADPASDAFRLQDGFDAVVMLTWSNWRTEPRSNRFHYATRFSRHVPVLFVQPDLVEGNTTCEPTEYDNIEIIHVPATFDDRQTLLLSKELTRRNVFRPMLWCYNVFFEKFYARQPAVLKVYHATEDYFTAVKGWSVGQDVVREPLRRILQRTNLLVAVSDGVADSYKEKGGYRGHVAIIKNGCDYDAWVKLESFKYRPETGTPPAALFQGGINGRLDYDLLLAVTEKLPHWQFWFCGRSNDAGDGWERLQQQKNVRYFGQLDIPGIAELARKAAIGLIPFKQDELIRRSLPLKAYEYAACGLPVVTVPIDELKKDKSLFTEARTADEFVSSMVELRPTRSDPECVETRLARSYLNSYEIRFDLLRQEIYRATKVAPRQDALNIIVLYDEDSVFVETIHEHLQALSRYSRNSIFFRHASSSGLKTKEGSAERPFFFDVFDVIVIHYSIRVSVIHHLASDLVEPIATATCLKILMIQDEYDTTSVAHDWIERLGINTLFTNVPLQVIDLVYPRSRFPSLDFVPTLTGYVPESDSIEDYVTPVHERSVLIGYRGRRLPHQYGDLGYEKAEIGIRVAQHARARDMNVDIQVDDRHRIYGSDWYKFLGSCRATLGTESGSNIFDFDGRLRKLAAEHADMSYPKFRSKFLNNVGPLVPMNQISPKIFEAIRLRTALILFEGSYSGVIEANTHYLELKKDFSNIDQVLDQLSDDKLIDDMTNRAYVDIIGSGKFSYRSFVGTFDAYVQSKLPKTRRAQVATVPVWARDSAGSEVYSASEHNFHLGVSNVVLGRELDTRGLIAMTGDLVGVRSAQGGSRTAGSFGGSEKGVPIRLRRRVRRAILGFTTRQRAGQPTRRDRVIRKILDLLPERLRDLARLWLSA